MAAVRQLVVELTNLLSQTKRRETELRQSTENSLAILKAYTSGSDEARFLRSIDSHVVTAPFLIACSTRNAKYSTLSLMCIQTLINFKVIKTSQLSPVVEALQEAAHLGSDIQLRILQILPNLVNEYGGVASSDQIVSILSLCASLQNVGNKSIVVVNTAIATLQQLVLSVFERAAEDHKHTGKDAAVERTFTVAIDGDVDDPNEHSGKSHKTCKISAKEYDALRVFSDICTLTEGHKPSFVTFTSIPETFGLELLESILTNHTDAFKTQPELIHVLRTKVAPMVLRAFSDKREFPVTVRSARILFLCIDRLLPVLNAECEAMLFLLNHILADSSNNVPTWKKILCSEMLRSIFQQFPLVAHIFAEYDQNSQVMNSTENETDSHSTQRKAVITLLAGSLCKISSDTVDASKAYEAMATNINEATYDHPEIAAEDPYFLSKTSSPARMPFIDLLDKADPPTNVSSSYLYYLAFDSLVSLVEELWKHCEDPKAVASVKAILMNIWSEMYRSFVAYLQSSSGMDNEIFHKLVRQTQKFAHTCGQVGIVEARDSMIDLVCQGSVDVTQSAGTSLSSRNLLFCRALLNLCISLGSSLDYTAWTIVFKTLFHCDCVVNGVAKSRKVAPGKPMIFAQYTQVDTAFSRLIGNTTSFADIEFYQMIEALMQVEKESGVGKHRTTFLLDILGELCLLNVERFLLLSRDTDKNLWDLFINYCKSLILERSDSTQTRAAGIFDELVLKSCAMSHDRGDHKGQEKQLFLSGLYDQVDLLSTTKETRLTDLHLMVIETLKKVLDQCSGKFQKSEWETIFGIIQSVFTSVNRTSKLVQTGFECITLVCNDFLQTVATVCLVKLISTLALFCTPQEKETTNKVDVNVSFAAISLFWTISDYLMRSSTERSEYPELEASTEQQLMQKAETADMSALWVLCLLKLAEVCEDPRSQVRHGAIQVLFRIFEAHGSQLGLKTWKSCQVIVEPALFQVKDQGDETLALILAGFSSLYGGFLSKFLEMGDDDFIILWNRLLDYFQKLANIDVNPDLTLAVYKSLQIILESTNEESNRFSLPGQAIERAWQFWTTQPVPQNTKEAKATQEAVIGLVTMHTPLVGLGSSHAKTCLPASVDLLTRSAALRYLPQFHSDKDHLSPLQDRALRELCSIDEKEPLVLEALANLASLCFLSEDGDSEQQTFDDSSAKRPTYISLCLDSLTILDKRLNVATALSTKTTEIILKALLVPMQKKFECPEISKKEPIWRIATRLFVQIEQKWFAGAEKNDSTIERLILDCGKAILQYNSDNVDMSITSDQFDEYEKFDIDAYEQFIAIIVPAQVSNGFWDQLVSQLFESSILQASDWDTYKRKKEVSDLYEPPFFGSTARPRLSRRRKMCYKCLDELFRLSSLDDFDKDEIAYIAKTTQQLLQWRVALSLCRYVGDQPLRGRAPTPIELGMELNTILDKCRSTCSKSQSLKDVLHNLVGLIARCIGVASVDTNVLQKLQDLLLAIMN